MALYARSFRRCIDRVFFFLSFFFLPLVMLLNVMCLFWWGMKMSYLQGWICGLWTLGLPRRGCSLWSVNTPTGSQGHQKADILVLSACSCWTDPKCWQSPGRRSPEHIQQNKQNNEVFFHVFICQLLLWNCRQKIPNSMMNSFTTSYQKHLSTVLSKNIHN